MRLNLQSVPAVPLEVLASNFRGCLQRRLPHIEIGPPLPQKVAIVAGGPSVAESLETFRNWEGFVVAINGAHDWLQDNGIIPDAMILCDPVATAAGYCQHPNDTTTYLIASCCHPSVFDALEGKRVVMWHSMQGAHFEAAIGEGNPLIIGGPSCATRAPHLLHTMGWRTFHVFGVDCSFGNKTHAVLNFGLSEHEGVRSQPIFVEADGNFYQTEMQMVLQAEYLWEMVKAAPEDTKIVIHGYGLGPAVVKAKGQFEILEQ